MLCTSDGVIKHMTKSLLQPQCVYIQEVDSNWPLKLMSSQFYSVSII